MQIEWADPPASARKLGSRAGKYEECALALRQHPGRWGRLPHDLPTLRSVEALAQNIRRAKVKGFEVEDGGQFETAVDRAELGIYVRYLAPASEPDLPDDTGDTGDDVVECPRFTDDVERGPLARDVRAWAVTRGIVVPAKGRLPQSLFEDYQADQRRRQEIRRV